MSTDTNTRTIADLEKQLARKERDWESMIRINHDFFHCWRRAAEEKLSPQDANDLVMRFWELVGVGTGEMYLARGGKPENLEQIAFTMMRASHVMGETAHMSMEGDASVLVHTACPWTDSFRDSGAPNQCQAGCDHWFQVTAKTISPKLRVTTESALPAGASSCTRRFTLAK
jgi:hypothetical protein